MSQNFLDRSAILGADDLPFRDVDVPEWGGVVRIVGLDGKQASAFSRRMVRVGPDGKPQALGLDNFMAKLVALTLIDPQTGKPIFEEDDIEVLGKKSAKVLKRLSDIAAELSGMSDEAVKDAAKNSETPDADLLTG